MKTKISVTMKLSSIKYTMPVNMHKLIQMQVWSCYTY